MTTSTRSTTQPIVLECFCDGWDFCFSGTLICFFFSLARSTPISFYVCVFLCLRSVVRLSSETRVRLPMKRKCNALEEQAAPVRPKMSTAPLVVSRSFDKGLWRTAIECWLETHDFWDTILRIW